MEFLTDLRSRFALRSKSAPASAPGHWEQLLASGQFLVLEINRSSLIQSANEAISLLRETDPGDEVGNSLLFLVHADDRAGFSERVREAFAGQGGEPVAARLLGSQDRILSVRWTLLPLADESGAVGSVLCVGVDFTGQLDSSRRQEAAGRELTELRETIARLEAEKEGLRQELEAQKAAAEHADNHGPIPGIDGGPLEGPAPTLAQLERRYIVHTLKRTGGRVSGAKGAASILGMHPNTLRSRMEKFGIARTVSTN